MAHPDDEFHPPTSDDPYWTETCWFTFSVPERRLSGQLYPFFRPNQRICAAGAYFWDDRGTQLWNVRYAKNFWHLPMPDQPLSDIRLPNGIAYRCLEPLRRYELSYDDPDGDELSVRLTFTAVAEPNYLGQSHLDQPGRYRGTIVLNREEIPVDSFGFRDRSWGVRSQFGAGYGGNAYSYATAAEGHGFHAITMERADLGSTAGAEPGHGYHAIHGYLMREGTWSKLASARREVLERDGVNGWPRRVRIEGEDELGRRLEAEGRTVNGIGLFLNPNLFTVNCLTEWSFDGVTGWGEDHDNWSASGAHHFFRRQLGFDGP